MTETVTNGVRRRCLVFEGDVEGIGLEGVYSVPRERGYEPQNTAGAPAGVMVAALISSVTARTS